MRFERIERPILTGVSVLLGSGLLFAAALSSNSGFWPMWGGRPDRNMVQPDRVGVPIEWDINTGINVKWVAELGSQSYGNPVVSGGKILVGTNNESQKDPATTGDKGVVMCFRESDGKFLWQAVHDKLPSGRVNDWPLQGICSSSYIDGDRAFYVSNRCELVCVDLEGFSDGENDGLIQDEQGARPIDADFVWKLDMMRELGVFPHNLAVCSPLVVGDRVFIVTGNGVDEGHRRIPSPRAPSFIAVNKRTGEVDWIDRSPDRNILHGQWSNPCFGVVHDQPLVLFPGGDGWMYAMDAAGDPDRPGQAKVAWKFDCNPKESVWLLGGRGTRNNIVATPVFHDNKIYVGVGQDPEHGIGVGHLWCIDATRSGDVSPELVYSRNNPATPLPHQNPQALDPARGEFAKPNPNSALVWHYGGLDEKGEPIFGRTMSTVAIHDDLLFVAELAGYLHCLDRKTGKPYWKYDFLSAIWGSPYIVDGKVYIGDEDGVVRAFAADKNMKLLAENSMDSAVYSTPVATGGTLYVMTKNKLYALQSE